MATNSISPNNSNLGGQRPFKGGFIVAKVKDVIINPESPLAQTYGGYDAIGTIFFVKIQNNPKTGYHEKQEVSSVDGFARPLFSFNKQYPLPNEIVLIITATSKDAVRANKNAMQNYYLPPLSIWNHPHHNIFPNPRNVASNKEYNKIADYKKAGIVRRLKEDEETDIPLGKYFNEIANIKPLLPYEGDTILEGRFGNTIRFGSTARSDTIPEELKNPWSNGARGENSDPITIIRNGQRVDSDDEGWVHSIENINLDPSSVYLTSNQKIENFIVASDEFGSFGINVTIPKSDQEEANDAIEDPQTFATAEEVEVDIEEDDDDGTGGFTETSQPEENPDEEVIDYDSQQTGSLQEEQTLTEEEAFTSEDDTTEYYQLDESQTEPEAIERPPLPESYALATSENNCGNCFFHENNYCNNWKAKVRGNHENPWVCAAWKKIEPPAPDPFDDYPKSLRIPESALKSDNMVKSYGEITVEPFGPRVKGSAVFNLVGLNPTTITVEASPDSSTFLEKEREILSILEAQIRTTYNIDIPIEIGNKWGSDKLEKLKTTTPDITVYLPGGSKNGISDELTFTINSPGNNGRRGNIIQFFEGENEFGYPDGMRLILTITPFDPSNPFSPEESYQTPIAPTHVTLPVVTSLLSQKVPELIGESRNDVKITIDNQEWNSKIGQMPNNNIS